MRVTAEAKAATRQRILEAAQGQFAERGYEATTTRDIADAAAIAVGTLFNYFPTKESIVLCLVGVANDAAQRAFESDQDQAESLVEELFAYIAAGLRQLRPLRKYLAPLLESTLSPLAMANDDSATSIRTHHLETVRAIAVKHGLQEAMSPVALQLYWTLYTGVLAHWAQDDSRKQEATLALLDQSLQMFVGWLDGSSQPASKKRSRRK